MKEKNVLFIGSSSESKAKGYERDLFNIGQEVALQNYNLIVGGLFASAVFVINGFLSIERRQGKLILIIFINSSLD